MPDADDFPDFIKALPEIEVPYTGCRGHLIQGAGQQVVFVGFSRTTHVPEHSHAEQWELVVAGEVALKLEGAPRTYRTGDRFFIPAGVRHSAVVSAGYRAVMVFNSPDRYKRKGR
jgi:quercetin dioxygenase-like cupin family protein